MIKRYNYLKIHIKAEIDSISTLYELCMGCKSPSNFKEIQIQETHIPIAPHEKTLMKIVEIKTKIENEQEEIIELYESIKHILSTLTDRDAYLIEEIDLNDKPLDEVAEVLKVNSLKYLGNKHYDARKRFREKQLEMYDLINGRYVVKSG